MQTTDIVIFGGAGSGALVAMVVHRAGAQGSPVRIAGYLNDFEPFGTKFEGTRVLGRFGDWPSVSEGTRFIAPLHKYGVMPERVEIIQELGIPVQRWAAAIVDPSAVVSESAEIGLATYVAAGANILPGARIGSHVAVRNGACISHDACIGDYVYIGANAVVSGNTVVGEGTYIGPGVIVRDCLQIGVFASIGMGAVVTKDIERHAVQIGIRARSALSRN